MNWPHGFATISGSFMNPGFHNLTLHLPVDKIEMWHNQKIIVGVSYK